MGRVEVYTNQDGNVEMPIYNLPSKILCKVVYAQLKAEPYTDEVFAQITLLPEQEGTSPENGIAESVPRKVKAYSFKKSLTPSDTSKHGGLSIPKRYADQCFPPLDSSQEPPAQELVAKDLHGSEWRFRHIYRGQPKRHLITSGWSAFVSAKKLVAGDACIFLRGENGELYVGFRRATKRQTNISASVLSGHSMQHGILANAFHAISTGTMFTVYYRPWTSPVEFIIPHDRYIKSTTEYHCSVGTRFRMLFEGEDCAEQKCSRFSGTIVGIDNIDRLRWPGSEWRCLQVQWDSPSHPFCPQRISPWSIEPMVVKKYTSLLPHQKRACPLDPSTLQFPVGSLQGSVEHKLKRHSGVLQGQEIGAIGASEQGSLGKPILSPLFPQPNPNWHHQQVGYEPFYHSHANTISIPSGNPPNPTLAYRPPTFTFPQTKTTEVSTSLSFPKVKSTSSAHQDWNEEKKAEIKAPMGKPNGSDKYMLFGVNIFSRPLELHSQQVVSSVVSQSGISETIQVSEPSKSVSGYLPEKQCENCCPIANRSCTKVLKHGTALGRSVDLTRYDGYNELIRELDQMFDFNGTLIDMSSGWHVTYIDGEGDMMLVRDCPWTEFRAVVRKMLICPKESVEELDRSSPNAPSS
ncbi:Auxin response factor 7 [Camellia lanceoleosa]|uniref:Auxin response factor 7 n=1 Tax=Camellia lanceoleosa TaxID=1840588 RepID=A0ACC0FZP0_9ERIC|nr:Auxin response factor 7 [Camellia lanceoleosa]